MRHAVFSTKHGEATASGKLRSEWTEIRRGKKGRKRPVKAKKPAEDLPSDSLVRIPL